MITRGEDVDNPAVVKVVTDLQGYALYFSRSRIPFPRDENRAVFYKHIGVYAYRKEALLSFAGLPVSRLEATEKLEQLRALEHGYRIKVIDTEYDTVGVDTPEDIQRVEKLLRENET